MQSTTQNSETPAQDLTRAESYFVNEAGIDPKELIACGYFTTVIRQEGDKVQTVRDAFGATSSFVGLTENTLYLVKTRAPATASPLLENKGTRRIPREEIYTVRVNGGALGIHIGRERLEFGLKLKNRHFPSQELLVKSLIEMSGSQISLDDIRQMIRRNTMRKWTPFFIAIASCLAFLLYWFIAG